MTAMQEASVDAVVCDPPYNLSDSGKRSTGGFMGRKWDGWESPAAFQRWCTAWAAAALRVLKPGGYLLAFGGTRTSHRLVCGVEDAGFEIRDTIMWLYGSGFPKSLDVSKAIDKAAGAAREVVGPKITGDGHIQNRQNGTNDFGTFKIAQDGIDMQTAPHAAVKSRYGAARCSCLDDRAGRPAGDDAGRGRGDAGGVQRAVGEVPSSQAGSADVPLDARPDDGPVRELWREDSPQGSGPAPVGAAVLQHGVCGGGAEDPGRADAALRAGLEGDSSSGARTRQGVPCVRDDACAERGGAARSPSAAVEGGRHERDGELGSDVRVVPPHSGGGDGSGTPVDPDRGEPRRLVPDDHAGGGRAVARVCSWCALPDEGSLDYVASAGTALKPAHEPIVVARKPLSGTVAANVLKYGCGGINVNACRIGPPGGSPDRGGGEEAARGCPVHGLRGMRSPHAQDTVSCGSAETSGDVQPCVHGQTDARPDEPELARRDVDRQADGLSLGTCIEPERRRQGAAADAAAPRDTGTSTGDGASARASAADGGARPPHQRREDGQQTGELGPDGLGRALAGASTGAEAACELGSGEQDLARCTCREGEGSADRGYADAGSTNFALTPGPRLGDAAGRWPANVVLSHSPGCLEVGTRKIKPVGATAHRAEHGKGQMLNRGDGKAEHPGFRGEDGTETVAAWECVEGCAVRMLDEQTGELPAGGSLTGNEPTAHGFTGPVFGEMGCNRQPFVAHGDTGGASRFFYCPKADTAERNAGLGVASLFSPLDAPVSNAHPTVKPMELVRWLVRLVTPPGGTVLDPFAGSGTTPCAAVLEGFDCVGIESEAEYVAIIRARLAYWNNGGSTDG